MTLTDLYITSYEYLINFSLGIASLFPLPAGWENLKIPLGYFISLFVISLIGLFLIIVGRAMIFKKTGRLY